MARIFYLLDGKDTPSRYRIIKYVYDSPLKLTYNLNKIKPADLTVSNVQKDQQVRPNKIQNHTRKNTHKT